MTTEIVLLTINLGAIVFGAGATWQKVKYLDRRVGRIEKLLNGLMRDAAQ